MEVKRERYPYCVVLDFMVHYFKNEWRWDVDIKDTFDIYTKTIISLGSKSTLGSTKKKLEFGDDKKLDLVRTNVSFYYVPTQDQEYRLHLQLSQIEQLLRELLSAIELSPRHFMAISWPQVSQSCLRVLCRMKASHLNVCLEPVCA